MLTEFKERNKEEFYFYSPELYWASINLKKPIGILQIANQNIKCVEIDRKSRYLIYDNNKSIIDIGKLFNIQFDNIRYASSKITTPPNRILRKAETPRFV